MVRKKLMMTTIGLGAVYLLRNQKSRKKLMNQFQAFAEKVQKGKNEKLQRLDPEPLGAAARQ